MERFINRLRNEGKLYIIALISSVVLLILSVFITAISTAVSMGFIGFFFCITMYLYYFLGVDPFYKGLLFAVAPVLISVILLEAIMLIPFPESWEWLFESNSRGRGGITEAVFGIVLLLFIKLTGVKPFKHKDEEEPT